MSNGESFPGKVTQKRHGESMCSPMSTGAHAICDMPAKLPLVSRLSPWYICCFSVSVTSGRRDISTDLLADVILHF